MKTTYCKVAIVGAGPGGLSAAAELGRLGVGGVVVLERENQAGGIPRHCGHSPFGLREYYRPLSGVQYSQKLTQSARQYGADIRLQTTVVEMAPHGRLTLSTQNGIETLVADKVLLCTGNRETPRAPRLVSGSRPAGVITTGALQSMVYLKKGIPFRRPVIAGSELISFSALLTCQHAGIKPVAMIDDSRRIVARRFAALLPRLLGVPLLMNSSINKIIGRDRVEAINITDADGNLQSIECDGVVFSGNFIAEASLVRMSHLELDARSATPQVDQYGRCSDPDYFACGNLLHPVDTAGWCWAEGKRVASYIKFSINGELPAANTSIKIECLGNDIKYFTPQRIVVPEANPGNGHPGLQIRFKVSNKGELILSDGNKILSSRKLRVLPERRILLSLPQQMISHVDNLMLEFKVS